MYKLFLFVAFLAFAAAAPGSLLSPILPYSATIHNPAYIAAPYAYSAYSAPLAYNYNPIAAYPLKTTYY